MCQSKHIHTKCMKIQPKSPYIYMYYVYVRCVVWHCMPRNVARILIWNSVLYSVEYDAALDAIAVDSYAVLISTCCTRLFHICLLLFFINYAIFVVGCEYYIVNAQPMIIWTESYSMHIIRYYVGMRADNNSGFWIINMPRSSITFFTFKSIYWPLCYNIHSLAVERCTCILYINTNTFSLEESYFYLLILLPVDQNNGM